MFFSFLTSDVLETYTYRTSGLSVMPPVLAIFVMLMNLAVKAIIIIAAIQLIRAANIYIKKKIICPMLKEMYRAVFL
ncbi:MAG: hypothetical protein GX213_05675 [Clostridiaceae bacterium]|nr:hypothetical protein [Clostridiaceae bacterium]